MDESGLECAFYGLLLNLVCAAISFNFRISVGKADEAAAAKASMGTTSKPSAVRPKGTPSKG